MIGQKGIPATYGGVERHVEELARRERPREIDPHRRARHGGGQVPKPEPHVVEHQASREGSGQTEKREA